MKENQIIQISKDELSKVDNSLNANQLDFLFSKTPKSQIKTRPGKGGGNWDFVTGNYVKKVLNLMFGWDWDFEVIDFKYDLVIKQVYVLGKLTCRTNGNTIVKMQFGRQDIKFKKDSEIPLDLGNDLKAATTDALKKCANEIGIANDVYAKDDFKELEVVEKVEKEELTPDSVFWNDAVKEKYTIEQIKTKYDISEVNENLLLQQQNGI